jgi:N-acetyl-anhydromuramyl-L-alanine amidase AmpD
LLEPVPPDNNSGNGKSNSNSQAPSSLSVPRLQPPGTSLNNGSGQRTTPTRLRRVSLREELLPYTNNPDDLFSPPKADRPWKYVVLHHSASPTGNYDAIDREHRKRLGWEGCGYHFVIGNGSESPDGQIEVAQRWTEQKHGIHCRNGKNPDVSEYGIGICLVGNLDDKPPTPRQVAAARALVAYLGSRYNIPAKQIGTHAQLASNPTACPGKHFPTGAILGSTSHTALR